MYDKLYIRVYKKKKLELFLIIMKIDLKHF